MRASKRAGRQVSSHYNGGMAIALEFAKAFGPFTSFPKVVLPNFAVITGENGAGKTQLLKAIFEGNVTIELNGEKVLPKTPLLLSGPLPVHLSLDFSYQQALRFEEEAIKELRDFNKSLEMHEAHTARAKGRFRSEEPAPSDFLRYASSFFNKEPVNLLEEEVEAVAVQYKGGQRGRADNPNLSIVSMGYIRRQYLAKKAQAMVTMGDQSLATVAGLMRNEEKEPPPWRLASEILASFGFTLDGPEISASSAQSDIHLSLRDHLGVKVAVQHLSGGEQCLLALAIAQYASSSGSDFPSLMLLDECLAPLHPSIIHRAVSALRDVFCKRRSVSVIVTTHSPTLVALADLGAVHCARRSGKSLVLEHVSADDAIGLLTTAVPTMRFDPENRRQIFVEAHQDDFIYSRLYQALREKLPRQVSLQFVPSGRVKGAGSCDKVIYLVNSLCDRGVASIRGVVDWDSTKNDKALPQQVAVLAQGKRYAIENVMLDPLLVSLTLATIERSRKYVEGHTEQELRSMSVDDLQKVVDNVCKEIESKATPSISSDKTEVAYVGGLRLRIPLWAIQTKGHTYAKWVVDAFPELRVHRAGPNSDHADQLVAAIAADHCRDWVPFLPEEILDLFVKLCAEDTLLES